MGAKSPIEWTESTWNPLTGCSKVSPGCNNCYAERISKRLKAMGQPNYQNEFQITLHENTLDLPLHWRKPQMIFVNSMSDLFHENVPMDFIQSVFDIMRQATWHTFQILTKRAERLNQMNPLIDWPENVWAGVSVENSDYLFRIDLLRATNAKVKFLSIEPLLGPIPYLDLTNIDWVIVGGESGPKSRKMEKDWVFQVRDACITQNVPFFFKQWGGTNKKKNGRLLEGRTWDEMPVRN
jgi:protein gp37